jgi:hypothetical protein
MPDLGGRVERAEAVIVDGELVHAVRHQRFECLDRRPVHDAVPKRKVAPIASGVGVCSEFE